MSEQVNGQTLVGEIVRNYTEAVEVLMMIGMHCLGCPSSQMESMEEACMVHGIPSEEVIAEINRRIAARAQ